MTPKEKATSLLMECDKPPMAKQAALITAKEVLNELSNIHSVTFEQSPELLRIISTSFEYWSEVKGEIEDFDLKTITQTNLKPL